MRELGAGEADYFMPLFLATDVPAVASQAQRLGGKLESGPEHKPDDRLSARLIDPRGHRFGLLSAPAHDTKETAR